MSPQPPNQNHPPDPALASLIGMVRELKEEQKERFDNLCERTENVERALVGTADGEVRGLRPRVEDLEKRQRADEAHRSKLNKFAWAALSAGVIAMLTTVGSKIGDLLHLGPPAGGQSPHP